MNAKGIKEKASFTNAPNVQEQNNCHSMHVKVGNRNEVCFKNVQRTGKTLQIIVYIHVKVIWLL
jgi:hypothetical protein